jgi:hypothetical protein
VSELGIILGGRPVLRIADVEEVYFELEDARSTVTVEIAQRNVQLVV